MASLGAELLISADSHVIEDPHFWESRLPASFKDQAPIFPERKGHTNLGKSVLTPDKERILKRWNAGCREALPRFRDLRRHGDTGSYPTVARDAQRLRQAQGCRHARSARAIPSRWSWKGGTSH